MKPHIRLQWLAIKLQITWLDIRLAYNKLRRLYAEYRIKKLRGKQ